jgi:choline dehydrogenase
VRHRLLAEPDDVRTLINGCRLVHRIAAQAPLAGHIREWIDIGPGHGDDTGPDDAQWQRYMREDAVLAYHPAGTCRMAALQHDALGVVDARLRVHGIDGLRVADNSIMPTPVSSNTQAAAYVIGEKAADMLLQDT